MGCVAPSGATSPRATCHNKGHSVRCYLNNGRIERTRNHLPLLSVPKTSVVIMDARPVLGRILRTGNSGSRTVAFSCLQIGRLRDGMGAILGYGGVGRAGIAR